MTTELDVAGVRGMFVAACDAMLENIELLTHADQAIGDGDHGVGMKRGFAAALAFLNENEPANVGEIFKGVGGAIMSASGGASGAIFGTFFRAGNKSIGDAVMLDGAGFAAFLKAGLEAVEKRGGAAPGGKTMIDALDPAATAASGAGEDLEAVLAAAAAAAKDGVEATKSMIATTGKARTLGERSLGHPDPGAISLSIVLDAMAKAAAGADAATA
ncbi:dihydroxyacetone kinase-like protein [Rhodobium orientis]|uniref:Dihydroxyacetone kinase subunit L n=1 Tax=Rhodobium orientis TaxID=34017 RepID=A0A327JRK8_9HYPH|nr:dihydroxyacetone kinase subunit DhaL [Rhodobium orientis]MBB4301717.1 dihydroxyacetone kinase-like protein [Rhodobium orientis]MBK5950520.1 dihydroxyacetone kinase subunit L [Rhodobium orientis]RAI28166.1 dihydroxyacetone kinase subunit L [Rhodobium orientis]